MKDSELDKDGFDAEAYVKGVLEKESLNGVLKVEEQLIDGTLLGLSQKDERFFLRFGILIV